MWHRHRRPSWFDKLTMRAGGLEGCGAGELQGWRAAGLQGWRAAGLRGWASLLHNGPHPELVEE